MSSPCPPPPTPPIVATTVDVASVQSPCILDQFSVCGSTLTQINQLYGPPGSSELNYEGFYQEYHLVTSRLPPARLAEEHFFPVANMECDYCLQSVLTSDSRRYIHPNYPYYEVCIDCLRVCCFRRECEQHSYKWRRFSDGKLVYHFCSFCVERALIVTPLGNVLEPKGVIHWDLRLKVHLYQILEIKRRHLLKDWSIGAVPTLENTEPSDKTIVINGCGELTVMKRDYEKYVKAMEKKRLGET